MKRFLCQFSLFVFLYLLMVLGLAFLPPSHTVNLLHYAAIDKTALLKKPTEKPRLILVGGSNLSFGIYSPILEEVLQRPVVNMGIHASYGLQFMMREAAPYIRPGDVVVLIPEYEHYFADTLYGYEELAWRILAQPVDFRLLDLKQMILVLQSLPKHISQKFQGYWRDMGWTDRPIHIYHRQAFNKWGDVELHWKMAPEKFLNRNYNPEEWNPETLRQMIQFQKRVAEKGGRLFVTFPSLNRGSLQANTKAITRVQKALKNSGLFVLGEPEAFSFPDNAYFNTIYHLRESAQKERTRRLAWMLKDALEVTP